MRRLFLVSCFGVAAAMLTTFIGWWALLLLGALAGIVMSGSGFANGAFVGAIAWSLLLLLLPDGGYRLAESVGGALSASGWLLYFMTVFFALVVGAFAGSTTAQLKVLGRKKSHESGKASH